MSGLEKEQTVRPIERTYETERPGNETVLESRTNGSPLARVAIGAARSIGALLASRAEVGLGAWIAW